MKYLVFATAIAAPLLTVNIAFAEEEVPARLTFKECGAKYQAAKADGSLGDRKWLDYRRDVCGIQPRQPPADASSAAAPSEASQTEALSRLIFPTALATDIKASKPSEARMRTCLKSYYEAKQAGTLYGIRWIQKGGGYYSLCNARLKQAGV